MQMYVLDGLYGAGHVMLSVHACTTPCTAWQEHARSPEACPTMHALHVLPQPPTALGAKPPTPTPPPHAQH